MVEDDKAFGGPFKEFLEFSGFTVLWAVNGRDAISLFTTHNPDLVILDVVLPDMNGFDVAKEIRKQNISVPLIFMTGTALEGKYYHEAFTVLQAKNYLEKPINPIMALSQIRGILLSPSAKIYNIGYDIITVDPVEYTINNQKTNMREKDFMVFTLLLDNINRAVKRQDIYLAVWKHDNTNLANALDTCVARIRKTITELNLSNLSLQSHYGIGYKLVEG